MTTEFILRAMASNYSEGHSVDQIDLEVFKEAANEIKSLRQKLFPYADSLEISGMSWNGFFLIGDKNSISELKRLENRSSNLEIYTKAYEETINKYKEKLDKIDLLAEAGLCYYALDSARAFLQDIRLKIKEYRNVT